MSEKKERPQLSEFEWIALIGLCSLIGAFGVVAYLHREGDDLPPEVEQTAHSDLDFYRQPMFVD